MFSLCFYNFYVKSSFHYREMIIAFKYFSLDLLLLSRGEIFNQYYTIFSEKIQTFMFARFFHHIVTTGRLFSQNTAEIQC